MHLLGLHHVTAITADAQKNLDFYAGFLGLRLVKLTVNFDDPSTYHLYYGDRSGSPGSILTFFAWQGGSKGRAGTGQAIVACLSIPQQSLGFWIERCLSQSIKHVGPFQRFDESVLLVSDPDGLTIELVAHPEETRKAWSGGPIPAEHAIRGLHGVTLFEDGFESTETLLTKTLGYKKAKEENGVVRFACGDGKPGTFLDIKCAPDFWKGVIGAGTIHHVALRTANDDEQKTWHKTLTGHDLNVSPILDRRYFHSLYFHEPGGVLLEIATDPPGFTFDESIETLGTELKLPLWLEPSRAMIQETLPALRLPVFKHV